MSTKKYAVIPAAGFFGDYAVIVSVHSTLTAAKNAAKPTGSMRWMVIECDGAKKGDRVHSQDVREAR